MDLKPTRRSHGSSMSRAGPPRATGPNGAFTQSGRKPALGGALGPTREDAKTAYDATFEYSQRLSQQVLSLEADNVELQDAKRALLAENAALQAKVRELQAGLGLLKHTSVGLCLVDLAFVFRTSATRCRPRRFSRIRTRRRPSCRREKRCSPGRRR